MKKIQRKRFNAKKITRNYSKDDNWEFNWRGGRNK